jgi:hypothetical protein
MAIIDKQALPADNQAVTATAFGSGFYDTGSQARDIGGPPLRMRFTVDTTATAGGAATVDFQVVQADNSDGSGNLTVLASSGPVAVASLTAGAAPFDVGIPDTSRRYVGVRFVVATGPLTAGNFTAAIGFAGSSELHRNYASGYPSPFSG